MPTVSSRRPPNTKQVAILDLLYRFRFGTTELFTIALDAQHKTKMNERLRVLLEQDYIGRHYESGDRLRNRHASYYLLPKGMKILRKLDDKYDDTILRSIYKDKSASEQFIDHNLTIFKIYCDLKTQYGDRLKFFTKSQLKAYDYFPDPLPDAYFRIATDDADEPRQYFLEVLESTKPFFVSVRKARRYVAYDESGAWDDTDTCLPTILLACDNETLKKRVDKQLTKLEAETDLDELKFITAINITDTLASI